MVKEVVRLGKTATLLTLWGGACHLLELDRLLEDACLIAGFRKQSPKFPSFPTPLAFYFLLPILNVRNPEGLFRV